MTKQATADGTAGVVEVHGAHLAYRIEGRGRPCLVLGSVEYYSRVFSESLREHLKLVFVDLRHFTPSDGPVPGEISIDTYADDIERVRQSLDLGDVVVIGHSVHGTIALEYARRYPAHVRGVVAIGSVPESSDYDAAFDDLQREASEERLALRAAGEAELTPELRVSLSPAAFFVRGYLANGPIHWYDPTYDGSWLWEGTELNMPVLEQLYALLEPYDLAQGPGQITVPVLIAHGRYDYGSPYTLWERHRHKLPRHTFVLFEKSGHTPPLEEPGRFDQSLLAWIESLDRSMSSEIATT